MIVFDGFGALGQVDPSVIEAIRLNTQDPAKPVYAASTDGKVGRVGSPTANPNGSTFRPFSSDATVIPVLLSDELIFVPIDEFLGNWSRTEPVVAFYNGAKEYQEIDLGLFSTKAIELAMKNAFSAIESAHTLALAGDAASLTALAGARSDRDQILMASDILYRVGLIDSPTFDMLKLVVLGSINDGINAAESAIRMGNAGLVGEVINAMGLAWKALPGVAEKLNLSAFEKLKKVYVESVRGYIKMKAQFDADKPIGPSQEKVNKLMSAGLVSVYSSISMVEGKLKSMGLDVDAYRKEAGLSSLGVAPAAAAGAGAAAGAAATVSATTAITVTIGHLVLAAVIFPIVGLGVEAGIDAFRADPIEREKEMLKDWLTSNEGFEKDLELARLQAARNQQIARAMSQLQSEPGESSYGGFAKAGTDMLGTIGSIAGDNDIADAARNIEKAVSAGMGQRPVLSGLSPVLGLLGIVSVLLLTGGKDA